MDNMKRLKINMIYSRLFFYYIEKFLKDTTNRAVSKKAAYNGIKMILTDSQDNLKSQDRAEHQFQIISLVKNVIGNLTPNEFMQLFPIKKEYDGHKWQSKDYFYTKEYIDGLDLNTPIDEQEDPLMFLWEYVNDDISEFNVISTLTISKLRQYMGEPSLGEEWAEMNGIKAHTMHEDNKGNKFIIKDGKTLKMNRPRPRHLRLIK